MEASNMFLDVSSPSNSTYQYQHHHRDQYLEASRSESYSSATSPYAMNFSGYFTGISAFPSPESRNAEEGSESPCEMPADLDAQPQPAGKRKRENRYKNAPPSVLSRRRAQNRASQRAYRERKDQRIKDLEQMLSEARARSDVLNQAYVELRAEYVKLKSAPPAAVPSSSSSSSAAHHGHGHVSHATTHQLASSLPSSYTSLPGTSIAASMGAAFVDPTSMAVLNAGSGLEAYLYPNVAGYSL